MATFKMTIKSENAAFDDGEGGRSEIVRLLGVALKNIKDGRDKLSLRDFNGNTVGGYVFEPTETEE